MTISRQQIPTAFIKKWPTSYRTVDISWSLLSLAQKSYWLDHDQFGRFYIDRFIDRFSSLIYIKQPNSRSTNRSKFTFFDWRVMTRVSVSCPRDTNNSGRGPRQVRWIATRVVTVVVVSQREIRPRKQITTGDNMNDSCPVVFYLISTDFIPKTIERRSVKTLFFVI